MAYYEMEFKEILAIEDNEVREEGIEWYLGQVEETLEDISNRFVELELKGGERIRITLDKDVFHEFAIRCNVDVSPAIGGYPRWFMFEGIVIEEGF